MSLGVESPRFINCRFPRVSGDEPVTPHADTPTPSFSPRERG